MSIIDGLQTYIERHRDWSRETFGPNDRRAGVLAHIRKELVEIEDSGGDDVEEWVDIMILAIDGAWRAGHDPGKIAATLLVKQEKNKARQWPDWREKRDDEPIEHVRDEN